MQSVGNFKKRTVPQPRMRGHHFLIKCAYSTDLIFIADDTLSQQAVCGTGDEVVGVVVSLATVATTGSFEDLSHVPQGLADGDDDTLGGLPCDSGQMPRWNGDAWACAEGAIGPQGPQGRSGRLGTTDGHHVGVPFQQMLSEPEQMHLLHPQLVLQVRLFDRQQRQHQFDVFKLGVSDSRHHPLGMVMDAVRQSGVCREMPEIR